MRAMTTPAAFRLTSPPRKRGNPETRLHIAILHFLLVALPREAAATLFHPPLGGDRSAATGAMLRRLGTRAGVGDLVFTWQGGHHEVEVKTHRGRLSPAQREREAAVKAAGGRYAVCRSVDECRAVLAEWGVPTRERST
jgi:hypothetical protein